MHTHTRARTKSVEPVGRQGAAGRGGELLPVRLDVQPPRQLWPLDKGL
jgi:hypothetical protein